MIIELFHEGIKYKANLDEPVDLSIPYQEGQKGVNCFYAPEVKIWPVIAGDFVGDTQQGGLVNFKNVQLNPHGNGTHTECVGHIATKKYSIIASLRKFHYLARVVSLTPIRIKNGDRVIQLSQLEEALSDFSATEALILRTLPNDEKKRHRNYSGSNPPYIHHEAIRFLVERGVEHLLLDLPSVDREEDGGNLLAHKAFWQYPSAVRQNASITELIYVPNEIKDGLYLLNLCISPLDLDAVPAKPLIFSLIPND